MIVARRKPTNQSSTRQDQAESSEVSSDTTTMLTKVSSDTTTTSTDVSSDTSTDVSSDIITVSSEVSFDATNASMVSKPSSVTDGKAVSNLPSSPEWPIFNKCGDTVLEGLPFFEARKLNVNNFQEGPNFTWKTAFRGSQILSWKTKNKTVNLFVIGRLERANLELPFTDYGPVYRLELVLERGTMVALRTIMCNGPFKDFDLVNYPVLGRVATFSVKLKTLQKFDAPNLDIDKPFPFLFDGRNMAEGQRALLKDYPAKELSGGDMLAVETNISSYIIPAREGVLERAGYSLSLRCIYFLEKTSISPDDSSQSSPKNPKRHGDHLVSPRKNKKAGHLAVFSDED